jgi:hypothetical protein
LCQKYVRHPTVNCAQDCMQLPRELFQHGMFQDAADTDDGVASDDVRLQRCDDVVFGRSRQKSSEYSI